MPLHSLRIFYQVGSPIDVSIYLSVYLPIYLLRVLSRSLLGFEVGFGIRMLAASIHILIALAL